MSFSNPTLATLDAYHGAYGKLTPEGQRRLIAVLELALRMPSADLIQVIADLREMDPTL